MTISEAVLPSKSAAGRWSQLLPALAIFSLAFPIALLIAWIGRRFGDPPEKAVEVAFLMLAVVIVSPLFGLAAWRWFSRGSTAVRQDAIRLPVLQIEVGEAVLVALVSAAIVLCALYFYWVSFYVRFPADILIWSESDFVNDLLKLHTGYPLYTSQLNNDSFVYTPGSQALTGLLAALVGKPFSLPVLRSIQLAYCLLAAWIGVLAALEILDWVSPQPASPQARRTWAILWLPVLFLFATNPLVNGFVHNLHNDALSLLVTSAAFYALIRYARTRQVRWLVVMACIPALGFSVKQSLAVWVLFYGAYLVVFDRPRSFSRAIYFSLASAGLIGLVVGAGLLVYGEPFYYWIFQVLGAHGVSPLRSFQHLLDVWLYLFLGAAAGAVLLYKKWSPGLLGAWLIWLGLILLETYTSGVAWMINHIGPGSLLAGVLLAAALSLTWPSIWQQWTAAGRWPSIFFGACVLAGAGLLMAGLGFFRIPVAPLSAGADRYIHQIEAEFQDLPASQVLLDVGTWVYVRDRVVMKDRAPSIGERGYSETGDFSALLERVKSKQYARILVRNYHSPEFWYDHYLWPASSGIRQALQDNYREVRFIPPVEGQDNVYVFQGISVLEPR